MTQIVVGDQLTLKNIRASKLWRQTEVQDYHRCAIHNNETDIQVISISFLHVVFCMFGVLQITLDRSATSEN